jgi:2-polyprenyl-3-methyl-5-hydroxy-6-metoxy-1,4-benzoquinol methylase
VVEKLQAGAKVADIGCGHGSSTILMAKAYPRSTFVGSDYHEGSIEIARQRADEAGVAERVRFETAFATTHPGHGYDLVTMFDCLHDMGDPVGAARQVREAPDPGGRRHASEKSSRRVASATCGARRRPRSTWCSRQGHDT